MKNPFGILAFLGLILISALESRSQDMLLPSNTYQRCVIEDDLSCNLSDVYVATIPATAEKQIAWFDTHTKIAVESLSGRCQSKYGGYSVPNSVSKPIKKNSHPRIE